MTTKNILETLRDEAGAALKMAKSAGADHVRLSLGTNRTYNLSTKNGEIELLTESNSKGIDLDLFVDGRYGSFGTSDVKAENVKDFVTKAIEMVKLTDPDPARGLPEAAFTSPLPSADLQLFDPAIASSKKEQSEALCKKITTSAKGADPEIFHAEAEYKESDYAGVLMTSDGFVGERRSTNFTIGSAAYVKDGEDRKQVGWDYRSWRHWNDRTDTETIGKTAAQRALEMRGSKPIETGEYPVVVANYWGDYLTGLLLRSLGGSSVYRKMTVLADKKDKAIASPILTIVDDPLLPKGQASKQYDGEGMVAKRRPVIEKGVLKTFYFDTYWARKQGVEPTTGGSSNLLFDTGTRSGEEMAKALDKGIYINNFIGGNYNSVTGDFSTGVRGFYVENGEFIPVTEMNLAGNLLELLPKIEEMGNDPYPYMSIQSPAMRFQALKFSGKS